MKHILIVDDDVHINQMLEEVLTSAGYASSMLIIKKNAQYTNMSIRTMFHISKFYLILQTGIGLLTVL